jgi:hypothetical protein
MNHNVSSSSLFVPADNLLAHDVSIFRDKVLKDLEVDSEATAVDAANAYRKLVYFLWPSERHAVNAAWSEVNQDPTDENVSWFESVCSTILGRASHTTSF